MKMLETNEATQSAVATWEFVAREDALTRVLGPHRRGQCCGAGLGVTPTNLFGKKSIQGGSSYNPGYGQIICTRSLISKIINASIYESLEAMEKENVVKNQSVSIKFFSYFNLHLYTLIIWILITHC